ncbi:MAG: DUF6788 family protein [bacterium]
MTISQLRQQLRKVGQQIERQLDTLMEHKPLLRGSVYRLRRRCGKAGCRCTRGELHESWVFLSREKGVQRLRVVPQGQTARWREWAEDYRRFRRAQRELGRLYREALRLAGELEALRARPPPAA